MLDLRISPEHVLAKGRFMSNLYNDEPLVAWAVEPSSNTAVIAIVLVSATYPRDKFLDLLSYSMIEHFLSPLFVMLKLLGRVSS
jgi:hypothetical protein